MKPEEFYRTYLQYAQICTDSRKVKPGCLYFSLRGEHFNGNLFAADALERGSAFAIIDDPAAAGDERCILVPDVLAFLQELASYHRSMLSIPVIGLTGTNGKTTTKELIHSVLKQKFRTVATSGNLNNHIGVPLTILAAREDTEALIVEMGANHPGEIEFLCRIARPTIGLITNIGKAHIEGFGSYEGVIRTKNELYAYIMGSGGKLIVNDDDPLLMELAGSYPSFKYGTSPAADVDGTITKPDKFLRIKWKAGKTDDFHQVNSNLTGSYNLYNVLAAVSAGIFFGMESGMICTGIEAYTPENMRSQWIETNRNKVILDAYNANPSSMEAAITHIASLKLASPVLILGDMFELGTQSHEEHHHVLSLVERLGFRECWFAGKEFCSFAGDFPYRFFENAEDLKSELSQRVLTGCNILVKGSRGMRMERIVDYL